MVGGADLDARTHGPELGKVEAAEIGVRARDRPVDQADAHRFGQAAAVDRHRADKLVGVGALGLPGLEQVVGVEGRVEPFRGEKCPHLGLGHAARHVDDDDLEPKVAQRRAAQRRAAQRGDKLGRARRRVDRGEEGEFGRVARRAHDKRGRAVVLRQAFFGEAKAFGHDLDRDNRRDAAVGEVHDARGHGAAVRGRIAEDATAEALHRHRRRNRRLGEVQCLGTRRGTRRGTRLRAQVGEERQDRPRRDRHDQLADRRTLTRVEEGQFGAAARIAAGARVGAAAAGPAFRPAAGGAAAGGAAAAARRAAVAGRTSGGPA